MEPLKKSSPKPLAATKQRAERVPEKARNVTVAKETQKVSSEQVKASSGDSAVVLIPSKMSEDPGKYMSVSELEREVEAARAREAQLRDKLIELQRRIRSYDNVRT
ncbi:unnamed protein product [Agarophyton chilense]